MKKILLISKINAALTDIYRSICERYYVQVSMEPWEIVEGMMELFIPDMVVMNVVEPEDIEENVFRVLEYSYRDLPVLVVASEEDCEAYKKYLIRDKMMSFRRSDGKEELLRICDSLLGISGEGNSMEPWGAAKVTSSSSSKRVLVVDDCAITLKFMEAMLEDNYQVTVVSSGEQALKTMRKVRPDVILLDYEMPGMNGKETFEKILADKEICNIPVIFLTSVAVKGHIEAVLKMKPAGYLLKPADKEKLIATINRVV